MEYDKIYTVKCASTVDIPLISISESFEYQYISAGVQLIIDGVLIQIEDLILLRGQLYTPENAIYKCTNKQSIGIDYLYTFKITNDLIGIAKRNLVYVQDGIVNKGRTFIFNCNTNTLTLGYSQNTLDDFASASFNVAPIGAQYLVVGFDPLLNNERRLIGSTNITTTDNGAGSTFILDLAGSINVDTISERTLDNGVVIEGSTLKDSLITIPGVPTLPTHATNKSYVDTLFMGWSFQEPVLEIYDPTGGLPVGPTVGDRYIAYLTASGWTTQNIYEWNGAIWVEIIPSNGWLVWVAGGSYYSNMNVVFNGSIWVPIASTLDHSNLQGLTAPADDHTQYMLNPTDAVVDNRIARWDLTNRQIQNSGITIDDSNNISGIVKLSMTGLIDPPTGIAFNPQASNPGGPLATETVWIDSTTTPSNIIKHGTNPLIIGPTVSTNTAIPRFNGTAGHSLLDSGVLIDGLNGITGVSTLNISGLITSTLTTGQALEISPGVNSTISLGRPYVSGEYRDTLSFDTTVNTGLAINSSQNVRVQIDSGNAGTGYEFNVMTNSYGYVSGSKLFSVKDDGSIYLGLAGNPINEFSTDITLAGNSNLTLSTQRAVKTYIDGKFAVGIDNHIARYDGTDKVQSSNASIDDAGILYIDTISEASLGNGVLIESIKNIDGQLQTSYDSGTNDNCHLLINPASGTAGDCFYIGREQQGFGIQYSNGWYIGSDNLITNIVNSNATFSINTWDGTYPVRPSVSTTRRFTVYGDSTGIQLGTGQKIDEFSIDDTLAGNSDTALPTEKAVKTYVDTQFTNQGVLLSEPTGLPSDTRNNTTITYTDGANPTITITPTGTRYYYIKGTKYTLSSPKTCVYTTPLTEGLYYVYLDPAGNLVASNVLTLEATLKDNAFVSEIYWDSTNLKHIYVADERHEFMQWQTHVYIHYKTGTEYLTGLALNSINADGGPPFVDSLATIGVDAGTMRDEDIVLSLTSKASPAQIYVYYRNASGFWRQNTPVTNAPVVKGPNRLYYNPPGGGLTEAGSNNNYILSHILATNNLLSTGWQIIAIMGQAQYTTIANARTGANNELNNLITSGLPVVECVFIGSIIYQTNATYGNTWNARIRTTDTGATYVSWLQRTINPATAPTTHSNLSGLGPPADDHTQYMLDPLVAPTDNAVARWDGVTGRYIQSSGVSIDDSNNVSGVIGLTVSGIINATSMPTTWFMKLNSGVTEQMIGFDTYTNNWNKWGISWNTGANGGICIDSERNLIFSIDSTNTSTGRYVLFQTNTWSFAGGGLQLLKINETGIVEIAGSVKVNTIDEYTASNGVSVDSVKCIDGRLETNYDSGGVDNCHLLINPASGTAGDCFYIGRGSQGFGLQYVYGWYFGCDNLITNIINSGNTFSVNTWDGTYPVRPSASTTRRFTVYGDGTGIQLNTGQKINEFSIDGTLADNSDTALPTEKAVKTYVDALFSTGTHNTTWSGIWSSAQTGNIKWTKNNVTKEVSLYLPDVRATSNTASHITLDTALPASLRPASDTEGGLIRTVGVGYATSPIVVLSTGVIRIYKGIDTSNFAGSGVSEGFYFGCAKYIAA